MEKEIKISNVTVDLLNRYYDSEWGVIKSFVKESVLKYPLTEVDIIIGCLELQKVDSGRNLNKHLNFLKKISSYGIQAYKAAEFYSKLSREIYGKS